MKKLSELWMRFPHSEAVELAFERITTLNAQRVPKDSPTVGDRNASVMTAPYLQRVPTNSHIVGIVMPVWCNNSSFFNVPGWRNRQTQGT